MDISHKWTILYLNDVDISHQMGICMFFSSNTLMKGGSRKNKYSIVADLIPCSLLWGDSFAMNLLKEMYGLSQISVDLKFLSIAKIMCLNIKDGKELKT